MVIAWRRQYQAGELVLSDRDGPKLLPVIVADSVEQKTAKSAAEIYSGPSYIEFRGRALVTIEAGVYPALAPASGRGTDAVIELPKGTSIWIAAGATDGRSFHGLSTQVQGALHKEPLSGRVFIFRAWLADTLLPATSSIVRPGPSCFSAEMICASVCLFRNPRQPPSQPCSSISHAPRMEHDPSAPGKYCGGFSMAQN